MGWRQKLDEIPVTTTAATQRKSELWEKLQHRIQYKKRRRSQGWIWAAASLLALLFVSKIIFREADIPAVLTPTKAPGAIVLEPKKINEAANTIVLVNKPPRFSNTSMPARAAKKNNKPPTSPGANAEQIVQTPAMTVPFNDIGIADVPQVITASEPAEAARLKVVHINELGYPNTQLPALTRADKNKLIRFGLTIPNKQSATARTNSISFNISTAKKSSNN